MNIKETLDERARLEEQRDSDSLQARAELLAGGDREVGIVYSNLAILTQMQIDNLDASWASRSQLGS